MKEYPVSWLPIGVWFWRRNSKSRWFVEGEGFIGRLDSAVRPEPISDPDEVVLIDPNWCPVCFQKMPWPPNATCMSCGEESLKKPLEEIKTFIGEWIGVASERIHI